MHGRRDRSHRAVARGDPAGLETALDVVELELLASAAPARAAACSTAVPRSPSSPSSSSTRSARRRGARRGNRSRSASAPAPPLRQRRAGQRRQRPADLAVEALLDPADAAERDPRRILFGFAVNRSTDPVIPAEGMRNRPDGVTGSNAGQNCPRPPTALSDVAIDDRARRGKRLRQLGTPSCGGPSEPLSARTCAACAGTRACGSWRRGQEWAERARPITTRNHGEKLLCGAGRHPV